MSFGWILVFLLVVLIPVTVYVACRLMRWIVNKIGLSDALSAAAADSEAPPSGPRGQGGQEGPGWGADDDDKPPSYAEVVRRPSSPADEQPPSFTEAIIEEEKQHSHL